MPSNPNIQLGKAIKARREKLSLSLKDLAKKAKMSEKRLSNIEIGNEDILLDTLITIAAALDTKVYKLVQMIEE